MPNRVLFVVVHLLRNTRCRRVRPVYLWDLSKLLQKICLKLSITSCFSEEWVPFLDMLLQVFMGHLVLARDSYYSGRPLILDDMFDKVELKLRWYGSRSVVKYPRCSLKRQSTYADAEVDHSQTLALASIWASLLVFGIIALVAPPVCTVSVIYQDAVHMQLTPHSSMLASKSLTAANGILAIVLSSSIGYPITVSAGRALQGLWRNDLVALKGSCPGCGEEVFAFVRADESVRPRHKTECHVCERPLVFHAKVENSMSNPGSRWVHGRVYLVARLKDLGPQGSQ
ncbi:PGR5-like protein 1A, chloroplastic isoform X4 [Cryptomeria japonica]|uniref:PGR5-like protein 1A, chloroplastic isoform X4 n=1 Tax=Cryptomeria japonica TaxID=3369 RepID=UPI0025AC9418|nr:PGR5-like protein 1A, chloroplastic isoform X4 [Cryptomeria japonica]